MSSCCPCIFIQPSDFYSIVNLSQTVEGASLDIAIRETQVKYIEPLLCEDLYDELCVQIAEDSLTELNEELLCKIKEVHVRYAFADFIFLHPLRITKESIVRKVSDESEFVSSEENAKLSQYWRMQAANYVSKLKEFLKDNELDECNECDVDKDIENDFSIF